MEVAWLTLDLNAPLDAGQFKTIQISGSEPFGFLIGEALLHLFASAFVP
jgi:hypothetical protein